MLRNSIFKIKNQVEFENIAFEIFKLQYTQVKIYQDFCDYMKTSPHTINKLEDIPFLPIQFFKSHQIVCNPNKIDAIFSSSGTTGSQTSKHFVSDLTIYHESFKNGFKAFYGPVEDYVILGLLPSYLEREGSSLIYMIDHLIADTKDRNSGFYLHNLQELSETLMTLEERNKKILLVGVSYALLDLIEYRSFKLNNTIVMETGGMKGKRKELLKNELHDVLKKGFGVSQIHSEYGMTELLSQAYSKVDGVFECPPWMKVFVRDTEDPLELISDRTGGLNIIDLANVNSCSFIATQDLARAQSQNKFKIMGRFDHSDIRGCNLMLQ